MEAKDVTINKDREEKMPDLQVDPGSAAAEVKGDTPRHHVIFRICAVVGLLCAVGAWVLFYPEPETAVATGSAGVLASVCGIFSGRGCLRSVAITGLVACAVLVLVYVAFYWGLAWGMSRL